MDAEAELVVPITSKTEGLSCGSPLHPSSVGLSGCSGERQNGQLGSPSCPPGHAGRELG